MSATQRHVRSREDDSQNTVVTHPSTPPPPYFSSSFFETFVIHPPNINELDIVVTPPLSSDPDNPLKIGTCTFNLLSSHSSDFAKLLKKQHYFYICSKVMLPFTNCGLYNFSFVDNFQLCTSSKSYRYSTLKSVDC